MNIFKYSPKVVFPTFLGLTILDYFLIVESYDNKLLILACVLSSQVIVLTSKNFKKTLIEVIWFWFLIFQSLIIGYYIQQVILGAILVLLLGNLSTFFFLTATNLEEEKATMTVLIGAISFATQITILYLTKTLVLAVLLNTALTIGVYFVYRKWLKK